MPNVSRVKLKIKTAVDARLRELATPTKLALFEGGPLDGEMRHMEVQPDPYLVPVHSSIDTRAMSETSPMPLRIRAAVYRRTGAYIGEARGPLEIAYYRYEGERE